MTTIPGAFARHAKTQKEPPMVPQRLDFGIQRAKCCGMASLTQFDWGRPLVKLGEQGGFHPL
jgi:hypothetical protein